MACRAPKVPWISALLAPAVCFALGACGDSEESRGTSGAAIGAGTGAAVCAVTIVGIIPCAIVGGALGAAGGISTAGPDEPRQATPATVASTAGGPTQSPPDSSAPVATPQPLAPVTSEPLR